MHSNPVPSSVSHVLPPVNRPLCHSPHRPDPLPPQGFCTCSFLYLEVSSPSWPQGLLLRSLLQCCLLSETLVEGLLVKETLSHTLVKIVTPSLPLSFLLLQVTYYIFFLFILLSFAPQYSIYSTRAQIFFFLLCLFLYPVL